MRTGLLLGVVMTALIAPAASPALSPCATPDPSSPAFAQGASNILQWTVASPIGSGFAIEVATEATFDADGSFKDSKIVHTATVSSSARQRSFTGLLERRYHYHLRALARSGICDASPWSEVVATVQDATLPAAEFTMPSNTPIEDVTLPNIHSGSVRLTGVVTDPPGPGAPAASGPSAAIVRLTNTTPGLGGIGEPIPPRTVATDVDGTWMTTFTGLQPGLYAATVTGVDGVRNESATPDSYAFLLTA